MSPGDGRGRPPKEAAPETPTKKSEASLPPSSLAALRFKDAYAVLLIGRAARRHVFFGLPAAERAVNRAHARGDYAELVLVQLLPVGGDVR